MKPLSSIAIAVHPELPLAAEEARHLAALLEADGLTVQQGSLFDRALQEGAAAKAFDLWIALGGDGTLLRSGQLCGPVGIPVLGINMGRLGFLMDLQREDWRTQIRPLLAGDYWLEPRMMLHVERCAGDQVEGSWEVLNEVVVSRDDVARPVHLITSVDNSYLTTYVADGLIAATPTGSTAYALAAGGPVLPPQLRNFLIVPVAPHLCFERAIVLAEGSTVSIRVRTRHKAAISLDGQRSIPLLDGEEIVVSASRHTVNFVRMQPPDYFYRNLTSRMHSNMRMTE